MLQLASLSFQAGFSCLPQKWRQSEKTITNYYVHFFLLSTKVASYWYHKKFSFQALKTIFSSKSYINQQYHHHSQIKFPEAADFII